MSEFDDDIAAIAEIDAVPQILDIVCRTTGMGFAAVARVTERRWIACQVRDAIEFGMKAGDELQIETTICNDIRQERAPVAIDEVSRHPFYRTHPTPAMYGFESYVSVPIVLKDGSFFGTLCAIDPRPAKVDNPTVLGMFELFAALIASQLQNNRRFNESVARQREIEERLRQSQKMEAVGQLTGGLAHDFNNLLTGIAGSLDLMRLRLAQGRVNELERYITAAQGASRRATALTARLLAFSRRQTLLPTVTDLDRLAAGMEDLIARTIGARIEFRIVGTSGLWPVEVDPNQLENALLNLCINARDAMPDGGTLTVSTVNRTLGGADAVLLDLPPGDYVVLAVQDSGQGMPADVMARAFDPFYTTKPVGVGTGLGLSMVYGFARQSGGQVRIDSAVGEGTTVAIYLPRVARDVEDGDRTGAVPAVVPAPVAKTVLVAEDEPSVRMLLGDLLADLGYAVLEAADGPAALALLGAETAIDLLVTDADLPGEPGGRQFAAAARAARPMLKVLFLARYPDAAAGDGPPDDHVQVIAKPFVVETLGERIQAFVER